ncbi:MAG: allantoinase AllB [Verrucomicrobiota bacterium]
MDIIIRGGTVVMPDGLTAADVAIVDGKIVAVGTKLGAAREEIKADGLHIFPGVIDSHVHFNEPGREAWEGIETGSLALVAGGGTMFFDMPLNAHPPTCDAASFDEKAKLAAEKSYADFALWGGLVPGNLHCLEQLAERGVVGFKAFMSNSGIEDFSRVDEAVLKEGMKRAAKLGKLVAVHAESEVITSELSKRAQAKDKTSIRDYLDSRPIYAELDAIYKAIQLAGETKCALHIVHVSSGAGVALVASAQKQGVDVTCETCPHYLVLTEEDVERLGAVAKCAPPLRAKPAQDVLWRYVENGFVSTIGSDHSPSPPDMKQDKNFFKVWGGVSGVQHTLPLLISNWKSPHPSPLPVGRGEGEQTSGALAMIARLTSFNVAERFNLPKTKGRIAVGADADLALVDLKAQFTVRTEDLLYRHRQSPYVGRPLTGRVVRTILRGSTVFDGGQVVSRPTGQLVKPASA